MANGSFYFADFCTVRLALSLCIVVERMTINCTTNEGWLNRLLSKRNRQLYVPCHFIHTPANWNASYEDRKPSWTCSIRFSIHETIMAHWQSISTNLWSYQPVGFCCDAFYRDLTHNKNIHITLPYCKLKIPGHLHFTIFRLMGAKRPRISCAVLCPVQKPSFKFSTRVAQGSSAYIQCCC